MPGESYCRQLKSLMFYLCYVFWALINSLVCWFPLHPSMHAATPHPVSHPLDAARPSDARSGLQYKRIKLLLEWHRAFHLAWMSENNVRTDCVSSLHHTVPTVLACSSFPSVTSMTMRPCRLRPVRPMRCTRRMGLLWASKHTMRSTSPISSPSSPTHVDTRVL